HPGRTCPTTRHLRDPAAPGRTARQRHRTSIRLSTPKGQPMNSPNLTPGSRVVDRIWGGTESGTVTGVDADGTVTVQWDSARVSEHQVRADQVDTTAGLGDPTPRYAVLSDLSDEDTDGQ